MVTKLNFKNSIPVGKYGAVSQKTDFSGTLMFESVLTKTKELRTCSKGCSFEHVSLSVAVPCQRECLTLEVRLIYN